MIASRLLAALALLAAAPAFAHPPRGIAVAQDGRVYFSDLERIWSIAPSGRMTVARPSVGGHTHELFLDEGGHLFGEDSFYDPASRRYRAALWMLAPDGRYSITYGPTERPELGIGVLRDRLGCTLQADQSAKRALLLFRLCPGGQPEPLPGSLPVAKAPPRVLLDNVGGAAFGPDGSFFFRRGAIVQRLRAGDRLVTAATGFAPENFGIAVDGGRCALRRRARATPDRAGAAERPPLRADHGRGALGADRRRGPERGALCAGGDGSRGRPAHPLQSATDWPGWSGQVIGTVPLS
jgi:hypothetical protein